MIQRWNPEQSNDAVVMSREQMREFDRWSIENMKIPGIVLMENAGRGCARCLLDHLESNRKYAILIVCGSGNNGGDGYVIARHLANAGHHCTVVLCAGRERIRGDALNHLIAIEQMGLKVFYRGEKSDSIVESIQKCGMQADWVVDAFLGTGLNGLLNESARRIIQAINHCRCPVLSVDIPSGMDCDEGVALGECVKADVTVTFGAVKKGFVQNPDSSRYTGDIFVASIGIIPGLYPLR